MLRITGAVKHFEKIKAPDGVSLNIDKGEFFGLLGPKGAGKTTLTNLAVEYFRLDAQVVSFNNRMILFNVDIFSNFMNLCVVIIVSTTAAFSFGMLIIRYPL